MCGRYTNLFRWKQLHRLMGLTTQTGEIPVRYNVAPTQAAPVVVADGDGRRLEFSRWGLVPSWSKDRSIGAKTINARSETAATSPAFRAAFRHRRCLVPASGFYEWEKLGETKRKQPWYFTPSDEDPFAFAGLWESWKGEDEGEPLHTFTILTTTANATLARMHDRMPVILSPDQFGAWLDPAIEVPAILSPMLKPCPPEWIRAQRVGTWVNSPAHDDARCIEPVESPAAEPEQGGLWGAG